MLLKKRNILLGIYIAVVMSTAGYFLLHTPTKAVPSPTLSALDERIQTHEEAAHADPQNISVLLSLGQDYVQKARETADSSYYNKIDALMEQILVSDPNNAEALGIKANVALSRHNFVDAERIAQQVVTLHPSKALYYGLLADAQTELGKNELAEQTLQTMVDLRPDFSSFSRIAYARELRGDIAGAKEALAKAQETGATFSENIAWGYVELGKLQLRTNLDEAEQSFQKALGVVPQYAPALEQLGKVAFAKKDSAGAIAYFKQAFEILPIATYAISLGEAYAQSGQMEQALQQYTVAELAFSASTSGGVNTDMEFSLFLSEHGLKLPQSLELAQKSYAVRPSIYGADALAWAYYKNGQLDKAREYITRALRLGEHDPLLIYHASIIAKDSGNNAEAERLLRKVTSLNPHFSILYAADIQTN